MHVLNKCQELLSHFVDQVNNFRTEVSWKLQRYLCTGLSCSERLSPFAVAHHRRVIRLFLCEYQSLSFAVRFPTIYNTLRLLIFKFPIVVMIYKRRTKNKGTLVFHWVQVNIECDLHVTFMCSKTCITTSGHNGDDMMRSHPMISFTSKLKIPQNERVPLFLVLRIVCS